MGSAVRFWIGFTCLLVFGLWNTMFGSDWPGPAALIGAFLLLALGQRKPS